MIINDIYGSFEIKEPLESLINTASIQRLKNIWQCGTQRLSQEKVKDFTRYEHSIGVLCLLIKYDAKLNEQIVGLFHDVSHTAFSHVTESLFRPSSGNDSYQDDIHLWFLKEQGIDKLLSKYEISIDDFLPANKHKFMRLEQELPDICADRLDYNLRVALNFEYITQKDIIRILDMLKFEQGRWFFINQDVALDFAKIPLYLMKRRWASPENLLSYRWMADALKLGLDNGIITNSDIHFSADDIILEKLKAAKNVQINQSLHRVYDPFKYFKLTERGVGEVLIAKFRGIDPWIEQNGNLVRLSSLNPSFAKLYEKTKEELKLGCWVEVVS